MKKDYSGIIVVIENVIISMKYIGLRNKEVVFLEVKAISSKIDYRFFLLISKKELLWWLKCF
ncbi:hypothetical protein [Rickettsia oklahomensis]|uniref:Uncharacterized protein n=1 Tax=Rickettsia oklahomensis TaxID=3141789 RepID=A0AAU7BZA9_9RICK